MTIVINGLLIMVIVLSVVLLSRSRRLIFDESGTLFRGEGLRIVTRVDTAHKTTTVKKEWRIKSYWVMGSVLVVIVMLTMGIWVRGELSIPQLFLVFWLPFYAFYMFKVPMFRLRKKDMVIDERVVPYDTIDRVKAEDIGIGHMKYGVFEGADQYVDVTVYFRKKMKRNASFCVHKEDYAALMNQWEEVAGPLPLEEDIAWPKREGKNESLT